MSGSSSSFDGSLFDGSGDEGESEGRGGVGYHRSPLPLHGPIRPAAVLDYHVGVLVYGSHFLEERGRLRAPSFAITKVMDDGMNQAPAR